MARFQLLDIRNEQKARRMLPEARRKALEGSTPHMHDYLLLSKQTKQPEEEARAIELLQADSTVFAAYFLAFMGPEDSRVTPFTAEWMMLIVRYLHEDLHHPDWPDEMFHKTAEHDSTYLAGMLRNHGSATAQMTLQQYVQGSMDFSSREGMLLNAKSMQENYRWEDMTDDMFAQATQKNQRGLSNLQRQADAGDPDAKWVMGQLHGDTPVRIRVPN